MRNLNLKRAQHTDKIVYCNCDDGLRIDVTGFGLLPSLRFALARLAFGCGSLHEMASPDQDILQNTCRCIDLGNVGVTPVLSCLSLSQDLGAQSPRHPQSLKNCKENSVARTRSISALQLFDTVARERRLCVMILPLDKLSSTFDRTRCRCVGTHRQGGVTLQRRSICLSRPRAALCRLISQCTFRLLL